MHTDYVDAPQHERSSSLTHNAPSCPEHVASHFSKRQKPKRRKSSSLTFCRCIPPGRRSTSAVRASLRPWEQRNPDSTQAQTTNLSLMLTPSSSPTSTPRAPVTPTHSDLSPSSSPFHNATANSYLSTPPLSPPTTTPLIPPASLPPPFISPTPTLPSLLPTPLSLTQTTTSPALPSPTALHPTSTSPTPLLRTSTPPTLPGLPTLPPLTPRLHAPLPCATPKHHVLTCTRYLLPLSTLTSTPAPRTPKLRTGTPTSSCVSDVPTSQTTTPYRSTASSPGRGVHEMRNPSWVPWMVMSSGGGDVSGACTATTGSDHGEQSVGREPGVVASWNSTFTVSLLGPVGGRTSSGGEKDGCNNGGRREVVHCWVVVGRKRTR